MTDLERAVNDAFEKCTFTYGDSLCRTCTMLLLERILGLGE